MSDTYQVIFVKAGDGSPAARKSVAEKIATASKTSPDPLLKQMEKGAFIYKKGLPRAKAEAIAATLNKMGAVTEVKLEAAAGAPPRPAAPATPAAGGFDFNLGAPAAGAPAAPSFDFGGPPSGNIPGYAFDTPAASGSMPSSGFNFDSAPAAARAEEFNVEEPSGPHPTFQPAPPAPPPAAGGFGGFNFSPEAATAAPAQKPRESDVAVSRNLDYAESAGDSRKEAATVKAAARKAGVEMTTCPRCQAEVPVANECASCGVVMAKAGEAQPAAAPRRSRPRVAAARKTSPALIAGVALLVLGGGAAGAFFGGLLDPMRLKMDVGSSAVLKQYGVQVPPPKGKSFAEGVLADNARAAEIQQTFFERSNSIQNELQRLAGLSSLAELDQAERALDAEVGEYARHPANELYREITRVVAPYYPVQGAALSTGGALYMFPEIIELTGQKDNPKVFSILSESQIRQQLKEIREKVTAQEGERIARERATATDASFSDSFEGGLHERWQRPDSPSVQPVSGRLRIGGQAVDPRQAPRLLTGEPSVDYVARVSLAGGSGDASRAGLLVYGSNGFLGVVKTRRGNADVIQMVSEAAQGGAIPAGRDVQVRVEKRGGQYSFSLWNGARGTWVEIDRAQPSWAAEPGRRIGLAVFGGAAAYEFDDFNLTIGG